MVQYKLVEEAFSDKLQEDDVVVKVSEHMQVLFDRTHCHINVAVHVTSVPLMTSIGS